MRQRSKEMVLLYMHVFHDFKPYKTHVGLKVVIKYPLPSLPSGPCGLHFLNAGIWWLWRAGTSHNACGCLSVVCLSLSRHAGRYLVPKKWKLQQNDGGIYKVMDCDSYGKLLIVIFALSCWKKTSSTIIHTKAFFFLTNQRKRNKMQEGRKWRSVLRPYC